MKHQIDGRRGKSIIDCVDSYLERKKDSQSRGPLFISLITQPVKDLLKVTPFTDDNLRDYQNNTKHNGEIKEKISNPIEDLQIFSEAKKDAIRIIKSKNYFPKDQTLIKETFELIFGNMDLNSPDYAPNFSPES